MKQLKKMNFFFIKLFGGVTPPIEIDVIFNGKWKPFSDQPL